MTAWRKILTDTKLSLPAEALFLPTAAKMFSGGMCESVQEWFEHTLLVVSAETYRLYFGKTFEAMKDRGLSRKISMLISKADFGIQSVEIGDAHAAESDMMNVWTKHVVDGKSYRFNMLECPPLSNNPSKIYANCVCPTWARLLFSGTFSPGLWLRVVVP